VEWESPTVAHVSLDNDTGSRDFILDYQLAGKEIQSGLLIYEDPKENVFLLTVQPPARVVTAEIPPREYIFVVDVSGSMYGFPLDTAKQLLRNLIGNLRPTETFNVVLFSGDSQLLSPTSMPANSENIRRAIALIERQRGGGGTELAAALRTAIKLPRSNFESRSIVVITDGYIAEESDSVTLINANLRSTNFFAFGIGSSVNRFLIEGIARAGQGEPYVVTAPGEAGAAGERFREYIQSPVLTNVKVSYRGFDAYDVEPGAQPDVFAERPIVVFGKWHGPRQGQIEVTGRTASGNFSQVFDVKDSVPRDEHAALPQLWARTRIARLSDFNFQQDDPEAVREITSLGLTYSLLTRYTSFVAVLEQIRNRTGQSRDVNQPLPLPDGVSELAVGDPYASGAEPDFWILLAGVAVLMTISFAFHARKSQRRKFQC
jgi:Ca-activated chloride channel family protein